MADDESIKLSTRRDSGLANPHNSHTGTTLGAREREARFLHFTVSCAKSSSSSSRRPIKITEARAAAKCFDYERGDDGKATAAAAVRLSLRSGRLNDLELAVRGRGASSRVPGCTEGASGDENFGFLPHKTKRTENVFSRTAIANGGTHCSCFSVLTAASTMLPRSRSSNTFAQFAGETETHGTAAESENSRRNALALQRLLP